MNHRFKIMCTSIFLIFLVSTIGTFIGCRQNTKKTVVDKKTQIPVSSQKPAPQKITLFATGDDLIHDIVYKVSKTSGPEKFNFKPIYSEIKDDIAKADIAFINQETILGGTELGLSGYPCFNSPNELGRDLHDLGFDVVNHATNHVLDRSEEGIKRTLQFWNKYPDVAVIGINSSASQREKVRVIQRNGLKTAFLSYTYGTNGIPVPNDKPYLVNLINKSAMKKDVENAKKEADIIIVSLHCGEEYQTQPSALQKELAQYLADLGVNLIIGHHPHVLEPAQMLKGKNGNETFIAYSLGNLVSSQEGMDKLIGGVLKVTIEKDDDKVTVKNPEIVPVVSHYEPDYKYFKVYPLDKYPQTLASKHANKLFEKQLNVTEMKSFASKILGSYYKQ